MAYAALISLKHTIDFFLNSSHISLAPHSSEIIASAYKEVKSLLEIIRRSDSSDGVGVNDLDVRIREVVFEFQDLIESSLSSQIDLHSESPRSDGDETHSPLLFSIDLLDLQQHIHSLTETLEKMKLEYTNELLNPLTNEEPDAALSPVVHSGGNKPRIVGLSSEYRKLKMLLVLRKVLGVRVVSLVGMAGIGKTALAEKFLEDPLVARHFNCIVWVTVGRKCKIEEIRRGILAQVVHDADEMIWKKDDKMAQYLYECLKGKKYLIVLDDVWSTRVWDDLVSAFRDDDDSNGSRVLLTTRLEKVAKHASKSLDGVIEMSLLDKKESWDLLREKVFGEEVCSAQLEKAGKKIAENCDGLPLAIIKVGELLAKEKRTEEHWNKIAADRQHELFIKAYDEISKVLYSSYEYLTQNLKVCFLYMGVFPQNFEIPKSKLIKLWTVEGFLESYKSQTLAEDYVAKCLNELRSNNLLILYRRNTIWHLTSSAGIKTCSVHSSFWHLCKREAEKNKFFHVLHRRKDGKADVIKGHRRLCVHNNVLFGIKDVFESMECNCASTARSLLCLGPYNKYHVQICFGLKLLKVLDALKVRFYEFPEQVQKVFQLRYLAFTFNGLLPSSISKLWNLQFLIVRKHLCVKSGRDPSYLPMEIWDMKELKHLQIMGSDLPDLCGAALLPNLLTLLDVTTHSCTKGVFERIPNLMKLGIRIELAPDAVGQALNCLDHISHLKKLETLRCVIVNPTFESESASKPAPLTIFSPSLKKLSLGGFGYPWEYMRAIASLPNLEVLKLRCNAFQGPKWETKDNEFLRLKILVIEDIDLVEWTAEHGSFKWLTCLTLKNCYKLKKVNLEFGIFLSKVELIDCNPLATTCVEQIKEAEESRGFSVPDIDVKSSWDDKKLNA